MLAVARRNKIKEYIDFSKYVTVTELAAEFNVTKETIRRDLQLLESQNVLTRSYGGAYVVEGVENDVNVNLREHIHVEGKRKIANRCAEFIQNGDSVFLDASTTSLYIAENLKSKSLTVITNSAKILATLSGVDGIKFILIGGNFDRNSMSFLGPAAARNMQQYHFDQSVISCRSIDLCNGIMDSNEQQAEIRGIAIEHANKTILVADYTKFDRTAFCTIAPLDRVDMLVVDAALRDEWKTYLAEHRITPVECV